MKPAQIFIFLLLLILFPKINYSQFKFDDRIIKLERHPKEKNLFIAKFYNPLTNSLVEYQTMKTFVKDIDVKDLKELVSKGQVICQGEQFFLYPDNKKMLEFNYEDGYINGEVTGFYNSGEEKLKGKYLYGNLEGEVKYFYKNGNLKRSENLVNNVLDGKVNTFYPDSLKKYTVKFENGVKNGNYKSFYLSGKLKRKAVFKNGIETKSKCYDSSGKEVEPTPILSEPEFPGGFEALKQEINKIDLSFNSNNNDTSDCRIQIKVDTKGNSQLYSYHFHNNLDFYKMLDNWVNQMPVIKPAEFDGEKIPFILNLSFPVSKNNALWLGDIGTKHSELRLRENLEMIDIFYWEFESPDYGAIYFIVDNMPTFPGGEKKLREYVKNNLVYPEIAKKNRIHGKVYITFTIDSQGNVKDPKIMQPAHPALNEEALRIVKSLPKWTPGSLRGKPVNVSYTMPITFEL